MRRARKGSGERGACEGRKRKRGKGERRGRRNAIEFLSWSTPVVDAFLSAGGS